MTDNARDVVNKLFKQLNIPEPAEPHIQYRNIEERYTLTIHGEFITLYNNSVWELTVSELGQDERKYLLVSPDMNENIKLLEALDKSDKRTWDVIKLALDFKVPQGMNYVAVRWNLMSNNPYLVIE